MILDVLAEFYFKSRQSKFTLINVYVTNFIILYRFFRNTTLLVNFLRTILQENQKSNAENSRAYEPVGDDATITKVQLFVSLHMY